MVMFGRVCVYPLFLSSRFDGSVEETCFFFDLYYLLALSAGCMSRMERGRVLIERHF